MENVPDGNRSSVPLCSKTNPDLTPEEVKQISDTVRLVGAENDFATLHPYGKINCSPL